MEKEFYSASEMAVILGVSKMTLYNWYNKSDKDLPPVIKNAGKWLFPIREYEGWKTAQLNKSKSIAELSSKYAK